MAKNFKHVIKTDVGLVRKANEDSAGFAPSEEINNNGDLVIVCDGMGGHVGGATASQMAVKNFIEYFSREYYSNPIIALHNAIVFANEQIYARAQVETQLKGMGTTCTLMLVRGDEVFIGHVGDSRIYLKTAEKLHRITKDHSFVQQLVDQGIIRDEDAENHPRKNEILRALGIRDSVEPEVAAAPILPKVGDVFLMCTDGLNGLVPDATMFEITNQGSTLDEQGDQLINLAKDAGGHDNITVALVEIINSPHQASVFVDLSPKDEVEITGNMRTAEMTQEMTPESSKRSIWSRPLLYILFGSTLLLGVLLSVVLIWFLKEGPEGGPPDPAPTPEPEFVCVDSMYVHRVKEGEVAGEICEKLKVKADSMYSRSCLRYISANKDSVIGDEVRTIDYVSPGDIIKLDCDCIEREVKIDQQSGAGEETESDSEDETSSGNDGGENNESDGSRSGATGNENNSSGVSVQTRVSVGTENGVGIQIEGSIQTGNSEDQDVERQNEDINNEEKIDEENQNVDEKASDSGAINESRNTETDQKNLGTNEKSEVEGKGTEGNTDNGTTENEELDNQDKDNRKKNKTKKRGKRKNG